MKRPKRRIRSVSKGRRLRLYATPKVPKPFPEPKVSKVKKLLKSELRHSSVPRNLNDSLAGSVLDTDVSLRFVPNPTQDARRARRPFSPAFVLDRDYDKVRAIVEDNILVKESSYCWVPRKKRFKHKMSKDEMLAVDRLLGSKESLSMGFKLSMEGGLDRWMEEWLFSRRATRLKRREPVPEFLPPTNY
jgi:hypothetical protein